MIKKICEYLLSGIEYYLTASFDFLQHYSEAVTAVATAGIAIYTFVLVRVTNRQAKLTQKSIDLARDEFVSTQRPKLRVRNVIVTKPNGFGASSSLFSNGHFVTGQLYIVNVGGTAAHIGESLICVFFLKGGLPMKRPYEGENGNDLARGTLEAGESTPLPFQSKEPLSQTQSIGIFNGSYHLFVMGWIEYKDRRNVQRRTAFCREFRRDAHAAEAEGRFVTVENPDYEHEE